MKSKLIIVIIVTILVMVVFSCSKSTEPKQTVATPEFNPPGNTYTTEQIISIQCATSEATIRYTNDGSDPTESSPAYSNPIEIGEDTTLKAKAFRSGWEPSQIATAEYLISVTQTVAAPTFDPPGGTYTSEQFVSINCGTEGAIIRYTTDGSDPTSTSPICSSPVQISTTTTLKARGFKEGWEPSQTAASHYTIEDVMPGEMVFVEGGTFSPSAIYNVTLSSYYIGKYEVTQGEYLDVMGYNPSSITGDLQRPVEQVSWFNAIEYCNRLSIKEGLAAAYSYSTYGTNPDDWPSDWNTNTANHVHISCDWSVDGYRLPTEMEREFAARGGVPAQNTGSFIDQWAGTNVQSELEDYAWYDANSEGTTHSVGTKLPNELGLYDMSGNVWNWVWDRYGPYPSGTVTNPTGPDLGSNRVFRGGSWNVLAHQCSTTFRHHYTPASTTIGIGFRISSGSR